MSTDIIALTMAIGDRRLAEKILKTMDFKEIEEGDLIEATRMKPSELRRILYIMQEENLAIRTKVDIDREEGIRKVYWKLNRNEFSKYIVKRLREAIENLSKYLQKQNGTEFYVCASDPSHRRITLDEMMRLLSSGRGAVCDVCGAMLVPMDRDRVKKTVDSYIKILKEALEIFERNSGSSGRTSF